MGNTADIVSNCNLVVDDSITGNGGLDVASDTGSSSSDAITSDTTPTFSGTGEVGATVTLTITGQPPQTVVVDAFGNWSIDVAPPLVAGTYSYSIVLEDAAGNSEAFVSNGSLTMDNQIAGAGSLEAASDTGSSDSDAITTDVTPTFSGTGEVGATVTLSIDGIAQPQTTTVDEHGDWSI